MERLATAYLPIDRYKAVLDNRELTPRDSGSALFVDVSGFTPLSETYSRLLGIRRGAEEISRQMNRIFEALIVWIHGYGGSVIGFSGDAMTCWFSENWPEQVHESPSARAVAAGCAMLQAVNDFAAITLPDGSQASIGIKVSVASGTAGRILAGDPAIQSFDLVVGSTIERMALGESLLKRGELIVDEKTADVLKSAIRIDGRRRVEATGDEFILVGDLLRKIDRIPATEPPEQAASIERLRPYMMSSVYDRLQRGEGEFLAELRPCATLFLRFIGIDFDASEAETQLDIFLRWVQSVLNRYDGVLQHVTIGDKGSYLLASFGAPMVHEDDARRAANAASELRSPPPDLAFISYVQIGISYGVVWVGVYGAALRRTYGVLGDEVNVAARLMQHAEAGEVLCTNQIRQATAGEFDWEPLPPFTVKGKPNPISASRMITKRATREITAFAGSLIGREAQYMQLTNYVQPLWAKQFAGVAYIVGEAGMGKSRLLYDLQQSLEKHHRLLWMTCPADEIFRDTFLPFRHYLRHYFEQSVKHNPHENRTRFNETLDGLLVELERIHQTELHATLVRLKSFLGALVDLYWEDSLYGQVEPKQRLQETIRSVTALIQAESLRQPVIIQIEDGHWLDTDSSALVKSIARVSSAHPIAILITCRFEDDGTPWYIDFDDEVSEEICVLAELSREDVKKLAAQILSSDVSDTLAAFLRDKTGGNPFYVEQLVLDLRERSLLLNDSDGGWHLSLESQIEIPDSVSPILIARLDRLAPQIRSIVQTASVLGQEFELPILLKMLPGHADATEYIQQAEAALVWFSSGEGRYAFRHSLLRDAAYDMQTSAHKRGLHLLAANSIESLYQNDATSQATELAYHFDEAETPESAAKWYVVSANNASKTYALENAITYYRKALTNWQKAGISAEVNREARLLVLRSLGDALRWRNRAGEAMEMYQVAYEEAVALGDGERETEVNVGLAAIYHAEGNFRAALKHATRAAELAEASGNLKVLRTSLEVKCSSLFRLGELNAAREAGERAVEVSTALGDDFKLAQSLSVLGMMLMTAGQNQLAVGHFERALSIAKDPIVVIALTNNLGLIATAIGDYEGAALRYEEALGLARQHNIVEAELVFRSNLGGAHVNLGYFELAESELRQVVAATTGTRFGDLSETYRFLAEALLGRGFPNEALEAARAALNTGRQVGSPEFVAVAWRVLGQIAACLNQPLHIVESDTDEGREFNAESCYRESLRICDEIGLKGERARTLRAWAQYEMNRGNRDIESRLWKEAVEGFQALGAVKEVERMKLIAGNSG